VNISIQANNCALKQTSTLKLHS